MIDLILSETRFCSSSTNNGRCVCTSNELCQLKCIGKDICKDTYLGCRSGYPCIIYCDSSSEENSCEGAIIDASLATQTQLICTDTQSCLNARITCGGRCDIYCSGTGFNGNSCNGLILNCANNICTIQCEKGIDTCSNVIVNTNIYTSGFQCIRPGFFNTECDQIDQQIMPFQFITPNPTSPTFYPTKFPSPEPTKSPTRNPTKLPTKYPTLNPTFPTPKPTKLPTKYPTKLPSMSPTNSPIILPTISPTKLPTKLPTQSPTKFPTKIPTKMPTKLPTKVPSDFPTKLPSKLPTNIPTLSPQTLHPTSTRKGTANPTLQPITSKPTSNPTIKPTLEPTLKPTTLEPTLQPTLYPSLQPTLQPTLKPSLYPTKPTIAPTINYYVVNIIKGPTKPNNANDDDIDIYANNGQSHTENVMAIMVNNWIYAASAGGITLCCFALLCLRCYKRKKSPKIAKPAHQSFKRNNKKQQIRIDNMLQDSDQSDDDDDDNDKFIPPPPSGPPPIPPSKYKKKSKQRYLQKQNQKQRQKRKSTDTKEIEMDLIMQEGVEDIGTNRNQNNDILLYDDDLVKPAFNELIVEDDDDKEEDSIIIPKAQFVIPEMEMQLEA